MQKVKRACVCTATQAVTQRSDRYRRNGSLCPSTPRDTAPRRLVTSDDVYLSSIKVVSKARVLNVASERLNMTASFRQPSFVSKRKRLNMTASFRQPSFVSKRERLNMTASFRQPSFVSNRLSYTGVTWRKVTKRRGARSRRLIFNNDWLWSIYYCLANQQLK